MEIGSERSNFGRGLDILRRRWPWILLCCILATGAAYGYSKHQTKKYTATALLVFKSDQLAQQIAGLSTNFTSAQGEQNSDAKLVQVGNMAAITASRLGQGLTEQKVSESLSIAQQGETSVVGESSIVNVSASVKSPILAARIANTYAKQFVAEQQKANYLYFTSALATVNRQVAALSPQQRLAPSGVSLEERAQELKLLAGLQYGSVQLAQRASVPTSPSSPTTSRNALIGGALGLLLGVGLALLLEHLDPRLRQPEELEAIYRAPLLGVVAESKSLSQSALDTPALVLPSAQAEAFSMILARLRSFNVDRDLRVILVTLAAQGDGTTTIALHLAIAAAKSGSRTLLLEMDLRRPTLAHHLGIQPGVGLIDVLTDVTSVSDAAQSIDLSATGPTLDVLTADAAQPANPSELIKAHIMETLLEGTRSTYDLVVVDTPSLMAVSDAFPALGKVDGVLVVGRMGHDRRDTAERLQQVLSRSTTPLLGVVANCVKPDKRGSYTDGAVGHDQPTSTADSADSIFSSTDQPRSVTRT